MNRQHLQNAYASVSNTLWNSTNMFESTQALPNQSNSYWSNSAASTSSASNDIRPPPGFSVQCKLQ